MISLTPEYFARFTRRQAALFHLAISLVVAAAIVVLMVVLWYPSPWFRAAGGGTLMLLLVGVDVILGPLLTFIVYNPAKKSLVYDLAVIVMLQVAALIYGVNVMAQVRPAYIVYLNGAFQVVTAKDVMTQDMAEAKLPEFQSLSWTGPRLAAARMPADPGLQLQIEMESGLWGPDYTIYPRFYIPYETASRDAAASGTPLAALAKQNPDKAEAVASTGRNVDELVSLPLRTRSAEWTIVLGKAQGEVVGVLEVSPR